MATTTRFGLPIPDVGASTDTWGETLNAYFNSLEDRIFNRLGGDTLADASISNLTVSTAAFFNGNTTLGDSGADATSIRSKILLGNSPGTSGQVLTSQGDNLSPVWSTVQSGGSGTTTNSLTAGAFLTGGSFNGSTAVTFAVDATSSNSANKVVVRDGSGNFSANTITASLSGNASTASTANTANNVNVSSQTSSASIFYPVFANTTSGTASLSTDSSTFTWRPSDNQLNIGGGGSGTLVAQSVNFNNNNTAISVVSPGAAAENINVDMNATGVWTFARSGLAHSTRNTIAPFTDNSGVNLGAPALRYGTVYAVTGTINTSDGRTKHQIQDSPFGLAFIRSLRPVAYKFIVGETKVVKKDEATAEQIASASKTWSESVQTTNGAVTTEYISYPVAGRRTHFGLIAQEVKQAMGDQDFGGWTLDDVNDPESRQGLRYDQFIAPLIKAVQELSAQLETANQRIAALEAR